LRFGNPGAASLGLRTRRQSAVQAAARFPELNPQRGAMPGSTNED
jgi:hypothetical protein